jgi:hypothetical protein
MNITSTIPRALAEIFDRFVNVTNLRKIEVFIIRIAVISFAIHLVLLFLLNHGSSPLLGDSYSYLKAIYTPFSFILVFEILLMVVILPESMSEFIGKQFEIITLITLRSFFHDIGQIPAHVPLRLGDVAIISLGQDLFAAIIMCALTVVFHRLHARQRDQGMAEPLKKFVDLKKTMATVLLVVLFITSIQSLSTWITAVIPAISRQVDFPDPNVFFYLDFYNIMIIADVFLLIISLLYDSTFFAVVRNASFVISTILLRLSLGAERPMNHLLAIGAFVFSILILLVLRLRQKQISLQTPTQG